MLCCDQLFFNSSDWCISILAVHSVICSLGGPLSHGSPVVVFFDRGHPRFWNFYSTIPFDVVRVKSYMNCFFGSARDPYHYTRETNEKTQLLLSFTTVNNHNIFYETLHNAIISFQFLCASSSSSANSSLKFTESLAVLVKHKSCLLVVRLIDWKNVNKNMLSLILQSFCNGH